MRVVAIVPGILGALIGALILGRAAPALANDHEVVFAVNKTQLHKRPGEAAPVVGHADEGDELEVIGDQGRWLWVRNGKQVGWVTRTEVAATRPADPRNRTARSGFSGKQVEDAVKVTIEIDHVRGFDDPRSKAKNVFDLVRGDVATVIGRGHDGWLLVQPDNGGVGWIPASAVADAGRFAADPRRAPADPGKPAPAAPATATAAVAPVSITVAPVAPAAAHALTGTFLVTGGAQTFKMQQTGGGDGMAIATGELANLGAAGRMRVSGDFSAGVGATAELGTANLIYYGSDTSAPMATHEVVVDAFGEVSWGRTAHVAVRGGVHYATLSVTSDRPEPMLSGERIAGPTAGIGGDLPVWRRIWLSAAVDVMPAGTQKMSRLTAGTLYATSVRGVWGHATLAMPLPAHLIAALSYRFGAQSAALTDGAAMPKTATRADQAHMVAAGVGLAW